MYLEWSRGVVEVLAVCGQQVPMNDPLQGLVDSQPEVQGMEHPLNMNPSGWGGEMPAVQGLTAWHSDRCEGLSRESPRHGAPSPASPTQEQRSLHAVCRQTDYSSVLCDYATLLALEHYVAFEGLSLECGDLTHNKSYFQNSKLQSGILPECSWPL